MIRLDRLTTTELAALLGGPPLVALVPVGSVEPHGPHLPLGTDTRISEGAIARACARLAPAVRAVVAPAVPYGVTDYADTQPGAISIPAATLTAFLRATIEGLLRAGFAHVCLVNNHLEPAQDAAVRAAAAGLSASVACPLSRRWGRLLGEEFKRGECHAGAYETSLVLACAPDEVRTEAAAALPDVPVSLSRMIQAGKTTFSEMGLSEAYAGAPRLFDRTEGERLLETLAEMIATEVQEGLAKNGA